MRHRQPRRRGNLSLGIGLGLTMGGLSIVPASSLLTGLVSYWKLGEASGNRIDSVTGTGNDLTPINTPGNAAGLQGNAVALVKASSQRLKRASNATLQLGTADWTIAAWVKPTDSVSDMGVITKVNTLNEYRLDILSATPRNIRMLVGTAGGAKSAAQTMAAASLDGAWHLLIGWYDSAAQTINLQVDNGTATTTGSVTGLVTDTQDFNIGAFADPSGWFNGLIDEVGIWSAVLTAGQRTSLYGAGAGVTYPFTGVA